MKMETFTSLFGNLSRICSGTCLIKSDAFVADNDREDKTGSCLETGQVRAWVGRRLQNELRFDPAAAEDCVFFVKDGGLAGSGGALGL